jgi:nucleoside-diphosphate-sugar epimerase
MSQFTTVLVTGVTSYLAGHIVDQLLLDTQYVVRGTVRDEKQKDKYQYLLDLAEKRSAKERLQIHQVDLTKYDEVAEVVKGCEVVLHLASPVVFYTTKVKNPQEEIVDPMLKMTENVLKASADSGSVKKIIYTSSGGAIYSPADYDPDHAYNEQDYNTHATLETFPYYYGKVKCEELVNKFVEDHGKPFETVILNPTFMLGPQLNQVKSENDLKSSVKQFHGIIKKMVEEGKGVKKNTPGLVDVRDVARVHVLAIVTEEAHGKRILTSTPTGSTWDIIQLQVRGAILKKKSDEQFQKLQEKLKSRETLEYDDDSTTKPPIKFDTTQLQRVFPEPGLRKLDDTLLDTVVWFVENNLL